mmetsp:Transcript_12337/g.30929  ORF Transcript_12337/g.30929 Transcript_12337/m.30929 type:complete len:272 (+) Transcript_12337:1187-2002(+)
MTAVAPMSRSFERTSTSFSCVVFPANVAACIRHWLSGAAGRSVPHTSSTRFASSAVTLTCFCLSAVTMPRICPTLCNLGSTPTTAFAGRLSASHADTSGVSGSPCLMSDQWSPSSCCSACRKYLPSVQRRAVLSLSVDVTTAVPALPVNPVMYPRFSSHGGGYSLACASSDGTMMADTPSRFIAARSAASRSPASTGVRVVASCVAEAVLLAAVVLDRSAAPRFPIVVVFVRSAQGATNACRVLFDAVQGAAAAAAAVRAKFVLGATASVF